MNYTVETRDDTPYLACAPDGGVVASEADALELIAACGHEGLDRLLAHASNLTPAFFDLSTGLAGAILLRFNVYRVRLAVVLPDDTTVSARFRQLVGESNRGRAFGVFSDRQDAERWLTRT